MREFSAAAGIDKIVSPHRIRHSAITAYLDASNGNIRAAQGLSRHANLNTLNRYDDNRHKYQAQATNTRCLSSNCAESAVKPTKLTEQGF